MIGLPTAVSARIWAGSMPASAVTSAISVASAARTAAVISATPPGFIMT